MVRSHWVTSACFCVDDESVERDGWFPTGDIANIDANGFMQITDRSTDVIKAGGEWVSDRAREHRSPSPGVVAAACVAARHCVRY
jgi:fatty-acyl-CoA synthase